MDDLVFATLLIDLQNMWTETVSQKDLIELLYDGVADPCHLTDGKNGTISVKKGTASKVFARTSGGNVRKDIRTHCRDQVVLDTIENYFEKKVVKKIQKDRVDDLIHHLVTVIDAADEKATSPETKIRLKQYADPKTLARFLADFYLYVLTRDNVIHTNKGSGMYFGQDTEDYKHHPLDEIPVPRKIGRTERKYTGALYGIYGQLEGRKGFGAEDLKLFPKYQEHLNEQRGYYFAAEAVRRGTRDIYSADEPNQFEVLKSEIYEGVKEVYEDDYKSGMKRLRAVFKQAVVVDVDKCWLKRDTDWIGASQRKGVCHFLVEADKLKGWIRDDDGEDF